jgi:hypothetical protein
MLDAVSKVPLHQGMIEVIIQDEDCYVTAGSDGWIKWFKITEIDVAEADEGLDVSLKPVK